MSNHKFMSVAVGAVFLPLLFSSGCNVHVKKEANGQDKQVDINTLVGGIHVSKQADASDVGVVVYPGARLRQKESDGSDKSANVNISGFGYGIKIVALEYESEDDPAKILSFYKDQLKKYGNVLECHTSGHFDLNMRTGSHNSGSNELSCDGSHGDNIEMKAGRKDDQHIVAIEPRGKGSSFSLVYVRTHGKDADI